MNLSAVIDRLKSQCPDFLEVGHALTSAATLSYPAALVTPVSNDARPPGILITGAFSQVFTQGIGVWIMVQRRQDDALQYTTADLFDRLCAQVRDALAGWQDAGEKFQMIYAGGRLATYDQGVIAWREDFTIQTELRITA